MTPTLSCLDLPNQTSSHFVHIISNLLNPEECKSIIDQYDPSVIPTSAAYSTRLRHIFEDEDLARLLWIRLEPFYANTTIADEEQCTWRPTQLNPHFRFCKYAPGDAFAPHVDGRRLASVNAQSFLTVNIYLNGVARAAGGATRVLDRAGSAVSEGGFVVLGAVQPEIGAASVFRDSLFHDGEVLREGVKYLLRTDIMFEREEEFDFEGLYGRLSMEERGKKALEIARCLEDGGSGGEAVVWYRKAFKLDPELERVL
ncbi:hypothetical protein AOQ84DRAFT_439812 [Glonium stellatum]|uniref:Prolyl 4-hydroxylase alpha subunit domain-containing protein n=1 Tax=Glonium stellatum TaxID=574774 RepID=A0A8E2F016_9PEZI|nr:hypothetical protein AOQ84DRAFT_439812 [Glonium stellatum]